MKHNLFILLFFLLITLVQAHSYAQENPTPFADENVDDLGDVSDEFQEAFFEALKQKGIENYERALDALATCIALEPERGILYFERGKNEAALKRYTAAEESYLKSLRLQPEEQDVMEALYDVYYKQQDYTKAEEILKQLIPKDTQYKEDLARVYMGTKRYDEALDLLDALDEERGKDTYRSSMRERIYRLSGNRDRQVEALQQDIATSGSQEDYLKLIYAYSEQGEVQKAYDTAKQLQSVNPDAAEAHLALYKYALVKEEYDQAAQSFQKVMGSSKIPAPSKKAVLNDVLTFITKNQETAVPLVNAVHELLMEKNLDSASSEALGTFFLEQKDREKALYAFAKAYTQNPNSYTLIKNTLLLQIETGDYKSAITTAESGLELFPSQPLLYLSLGAALNGSGAYQEAIDYLEIGVDYLVDNPKMEADFYNQLAIAYTAAGNPTQAAKYVAKMNALKTQID